MHDVIVNYSKYCVFCAALCCLPVCFGNIVTMPGEVGGLKLL